MAEPVGGASQTLSELQSQREQAVEVRRSVVDEQALPTIGRGRLRELQCIRQFADLCEFRTPWHAGNLAIELDLERRTERGGTPVRGVSCSRSMSSSSPSMTAC